MESKQEGKKKPGKLRRWRKPLIWAIIILVLGLYSFRGYVFDDLNPHQLSQAELLEKARQSQVAEAVYNDDTHLTVKLKGDTTKWEVTYPKAVAGDTLRRLNDANVPLTPKKTDSLRSTFWDFLWLLFGAFMILGVAIPALVKGAKTVQEKTGKVSSSRPTVRLDDVKGMPEVVDEARKVVDAITNPEQLIELGSRLPAGIVLYGPPGTGKTMLAKAIAGEAGVPFYEVTGSKIRTKWIGDAAKAIRAYFEQARRNKVAIIFMDEGDTLCGRRSDGEHGSDREHRATVNEVLAQMNQNSPDGHVLLIIATNDPDLLDEALTRPGRVDLHLEVTPPDIHGRQAILEALTKGKRPLGDDVDLERLARDTYGSTGADIDGLINNAALHAASRGSKKICQIDFDHALTVMRSGPARKSQHVTEEDRKVTAYHEAGHTLPSMVLALLPDPTSVTVLAHAGSGGHTLAIPDETTASKYLREAAAKQRLIMLMGGVVGEKLALDGDYTNGAASDRKRATELATAMVCEWGMGTYNSTFGRNWEIGAHADYVRTQIEELLDEAEREAIDLILRHKRLFDDLVAALLAKETLRAEELAELDATPLDNSNFEALKKGHRKLLDSVRRSAPTQRNGRRDLVTT